MKFSPNIPVLRRPVRVSEDTTLLDASTSFYRTSVYATGTNYISLHQQVMLNPLLAVKNLIIIYLSTTINVNRIVYVH